MQVPALPPITLEPGFQSVQGASRQAMIDSLRMALGVGSRLEVTVARGQAGDRGVLIEGQFFKAAVPDGTREGTRLAVQVSDIRDAVVLKVLSSSNANASAQAWRPGLSWESFIRQALPPEAVEILRRTRMLPLGTMPTERNPFIDDLIDKLLSARLMLGNAALEDPGRVRTVLENLSSITPKDTSPVTAQARHSHGADARVEKAFASLSETLKLLYAAQGNLNSINTVMSAFDEKAILLIPVFLNGLLSRWELTARVPPPAKDSDKPAAKAPKSFSITVALPSLGNVQVALSISDEDLFLKLTCERKESAEWLNRLLPGLESNLRKTGIKNIACRAVEGPIKNESPSWFTSLPLVESKA